jgi:hypothetical protein
MHAKNAKGELRCGASPEESGTYRRAEVTCAKCTKDLLDAERLHSSSLAGGGESDDDASESV